MSKCSGISAIAIKTDEKQLELSLLSIEHVEEPSSQTDIFFLGFVWLESLKKNSEEVLSLVF